MDADVTISPTLSTDDQDDVMRVFRQLGVSPRVAMARPLRGGELSWLVLASLPLVAFLNTLGTKIAEDGYSGLRDLVLKLSRHDHRRDGSTKSLLLQDERTGTLIELVADLPDDGYQLLLTLNLSENAGARMRYDPKERRWLAVEQLEQPDGSPTGR
jgi:hypothetical protein